MSITLTLPLDVPVRPMDVKGLNGIGGRLLRGVKSLYVGSKACVRVGE